METTADGTSESQGIGEATSDDGPPAVDGRRLRRDRNREAVLSSLLDLVEAGVLAPTAAEVAERSEVSLRSVFRYFEDREAFLSEASTVAFRRYAPLSRISHFGQGSFDQRLEAIVAQRLALYPAVAPLVRAVRAQAATSLLDAMMAFTEPLNRQVEVQFEPELTALATDRETVVSSLVMLLSAETYELLAHTQNRGTDEIHRIYVVTARALLGRSGA